MTRFPRPPARPIAVAAALIVALLASLAMPASASLATPEAEDVPTRTSHPFRRAFTHAPGRSMDLPAVDAVVRLACEPRVADRAAVRCEWGAGEDLRVRSWQLWNLQVRPERGGRNLVAEVGADVMAHVDTQVTVPAAYAYAVLGLDGDGEVIARSRLDFVKLAAPVHEVEAMRLGCAAHRIETDRIETDSVDVGVGCEWSAATSDRAVGYVIWKSVVGEARSVLARVGLDTTLIRDDDVEFGHRYTYVATAVDADGEVVGQSRAETVAIPNHDRPVEPPVDRPIEPPVDRPIEPPVEPPVDRTAEPVRGERQAAN